MLSKPLSSLHLSPLIPLGCNIELSDREKAVQSMSLCLPRQGPWKYKDAKLPTAEARIEESIILVLARNGHHIKIRSHHHILVTRPGNNMGIILWDLE